MQLLGHTVLVEINKPKPRKGLIELPDNLPNTTGIVEATVRHVGSGITRLLAKNEKLKHYDFPNTGATVLVNFMHGTPLTVDGVAMKLFNVEDILALVEKE